MNRKLLNAFTLAFLFPACACFAGESRELAKQILDTMGFVEAQLDMPWQHWQAFTAEQKRLFEEKCQYNRALLEADLVDYLVEEFSEHELKEIHDFYASDTGQKWVSSTALRGGFESPPFNEAGSAWRDRRYGEARSYAVAIMQNEEWTTPAYRGIVGDKTAPIDSAYDGTPPIDPIGKDEAYFVQTFGTPEERFETDTGTQSYLRLKTTWRAYFVEATLLAGKLSRISFVRLPNEGDTYVDKMRTTLTEQEVRAFKNQLSGSKPWSEDPSQTGEGRIVYRLQNWELHCSQMGYTILFDIDPSFGRSPGP